MKPFLFSLSCALKGIRLLFANQKNAQYQGIIAVIVCLMGWIFGLSITEWMLITICIGLVFFAEGVNSSLEYLVDFVSPEYHIKAGKIKDLAAGSVLILALTTLLIGLVIFLPKIFLFFEAKGN
jgi:diacylglycerol kinase